jgi:hypothetical protein
MDHYALLLVISGILIGAGSVIALVTLVFLFWAGLDRHDETINKK